MMDKSYNRPVGSNKEGYQGAGGSVCVTQPTGNGMGKAVMSKAPSYGEYGKVLSVKTGHSEVGSKI